MDLKKLITLCLSAVLVAGLAVGTSVYADDDDNGDRNERGERHERSERNDRNGRGYKTPENALYSQECSSCHFLYLPGLLNAASWNKLMDNTDKHFGENLGLDEKTTADLRAFLTANSSEKTPTEYGRKITQSAGNKAYERIFDVPWINKEHRKIKADVFKRPSIGSSSNCGACHKGGAKGDFEEDSITIPKQ